MEEEKPIVTVIDAMCGKGKTSYAIQEINQHSEKSYIYVTPLLSEIERIKEATTKQFHDPVYKDGRKINGLNNLLCSGYNIAVTHSTFSNATDETVELIHQGQYTLILDEVLDVISEFNDIVNGNKQKIKKKDIEMLIEKEHIEVDKYGRVSWIGKSYMGGSFTEVERLAKRGNLLLINDTLFLWEFPIDVFRAFDEVLILTYLFDGSFLKYFFDYHGIQYQLKGVETCDERQYHLCEYSNDITERQKYKKLIDLFSDEKMEDYPYSAFSSTWFAKNVGKDKDNPIANKLKNNLYNYFRHKQKASANQIMWTCFESSRKTLEGAGYTKVRRLTAEERLLPSLELKKLENNLSCFVPCNARASNSYRDRNILAYLCNLWPNPYIERFFKFKDIQIDKDAFSLSCLIQWVWRSSIRDGQPIKLYLPSQRMKKLFNKWLDGII